MSSEQQLQAILNQMHANAAAITNNDTSTTTEEEKANPEVFAELQGILGKMHVGASVDKFSQFRNSHSQETLSRVEQNSSNLKSLTLDGVSSNHKFFDRRYFSSRLVDDYSTLGKHMVHNTHLTSLKINIHQSPALQSMAISEGIARSFFEGLSQNSSIKDLTITSNTNYAHCGIWRLYLGHIGRITI